MLTEPNLTDGERIQNLFLDKTVVAREPETGIELVRSRGRRRAGRVPNYILLVFDSSNPRIRAWSEEEAIALANQKLEKLRKQGRLK